MLLRFVNCRPLVQKPKWVNIRSWGDKAAALKELEDSIKMFDEQNVPSH